jgi:3,4-dihydroxy 2-butanone 4-phosphate synthase/GTP cyclohydrolase II
MRRSSFTARSVAMSISPVSDIVADIRAGRMVILVDEEDRENEGDLVLAAEHVTPEAINFMAKWGRGLICLTLTEARCRQLELPLMVRDNKAQHGTAFTVSIEAADGVTTGISAHDRAKTIQAAVTRNATPNDIVQPGHIFPLMAQNGGVLVRAGHTEAGCDLARLAGLEPAGVICEILKDDGTMARLPDLLEFAAEHGLRIGTIRDLIQYRSENEKLVECVADREVSGPLGTFRLRAFADQTSGELHVALSCGDIRADTDTLVRVHDSVSLLDFLESTASGHTVGLEQAIRAIVNNGPGIIVLLHRKESGREFLSALRAEDSARPAKWDPRLYGIGAQILRELGVGKMRLIGSPRKMPSMAGFGLEITGYHSIEESNAHA